MTGKDKVFQHTNKKKQERPERKHTLETKIVAPPFVSISFAES